jgi:hypothetical protein
MAGSPRRPLDGEKFRPSEFGNGVVGREEGRFA